MPILPTDKKTAEGFFRAYALTLSQWKATRPTVFRPRYDPEATTPAGHGEAKAEKKEGEKGKGKKPGRRSMDLEVKEPLRAKIRHALLGWWCQETVKWGGRAGVVSAVVRPGEK